MKHKRSLLATLVKYLACIKACRQGEGLDVVGVVGGTYGRVGGRTKGVAGEEAQGVVGGGEAVRLSTLVGL